jgi:hypothetical protein
MITCGCGHSDGTQRPAKGDAMHAALARHRRHSTSRLSDIPQRQHECRLIAFGKRGVQVSDAKLGVTELLR